MNILHLNSRPSYSGVSTTGGGDRADNTFVIENVSDIVSVDVEDRNLSATNNLMSLSYYGAKTANGMRA